MQASHENRVSNTAEIMARIIIAPVSLASASIIFSALLRDSDLSDARRTNAEAYVSTLKHKGQLLTRRPVRQEPISVRLRKTLDLSQVVVRLDQDRISVRLRLNALLFLVVVIIRIITAGTRTETTVTHLKPS
jgi:hypothetical protein